MSLLLGAFDCFRFWSSCLAGKRNWNWHFIIFIIIIFVFVLWEAFLFLVCLDAATKSVSLRPGWDAILSHEPNRIEYRTTHSKSDLHFSRTKIQKGKTRISVNYIIKLIHLVGISFTFQLIFRKLFVNGEQTLFLRNFKKKFEVNGKLYIKLNPILEIKELRKLRHLRKKKHLQAEHRMGNKVIYICFWTWFCQHNKVQKFVP